MTVLIPQSCWNSWSVQPSTRARLTGCVFTIKTKHCNISEKRKYVLTPMLWKLTIWYNCICLIHWYCSYISIYKNIDKWFAINLLTNFIMSNSFEKQLKIRGGRPLHKPEFDISVFGVTVFNVFSVTVFLITVLPLTVFILFFGLLHGLLYLRHLCIHIVQPSDFFQGFCGLVHTALAHQPPWTFG